MNGCRHGDELQWYSPEEVIVERGFLRLRAQRRTVFVAGRTFGYTSGMVSGHRKYAFQYGYMEAKAKVPRGRALWPAFWTLPATEQWPPEIDVMEIVGHEIYKVTMGFHYVGGDGKKQKSIGSYVGPDFSADWHVFAAQWDRGLLVFFVDGRERYRVASGFVPAEPMYMIANLAVGGGTGGWVGSPDSTTPFPSYYEIDYIRVWQR